MTTYRHLQKDEVIQDGDEVDGCVDAWRDDPVWKPVHPNNIGDVAPDPAYPSHRRYRRPLADPTVARLHNNGVEVRVDMGNTGENWPNCSNKQIGFPWLSFGRMAMKAAEDYARSQGATKIITSGFEDENG